MLNDGCCGALVVLDGFRDDEELPFGFLGFLLGDGGAAFLDAFGEYFADLVRGISFGVDDVGESGEVELFVSFVIFPDFSDEDF